MVGKCKGSLRGRRQKESERWNSQATFFSALAFANLLSLSPISVPAMQPVVTELKRWTEATSRSENGKQFHSGIERGKNKDLRASLNVPVI